VRFARTSTISFVVNSPPWKEVTKHKHERCYLWPRLCTTCWQSRQGCLELTLDRLGWKSIITRPPAVARAVADSGREYAALLAVQLFSRVSRSFLWNTCGIDMAEANAVARRYLDGSPLCRFSFDQAASLSHSGLLDAKGFSHISAQSGQQTAARAMAGICLALILLDTQMVDSTRSEQQFD
jgi:hypothetical protein